MARMVEQHWKKPLADAILFGTPKAGGTAKVERKADGLGIMTRRKFRAARRVGFSSTGAD